MEQTATLESTPGEDADYEQEIGRIIEAIKQMRVEMEADQHEIEQLRAETRAMLAQMTAS